MRRDCLGKLGKHLLGRRWAEVVVQREAPADMVLVLWVSGSARGRGGGGTGVAGTEDGGSSRDLAALWERGCGVRGEKCHIVEREGDQGCSRDLRSRRCVS